MDETEPVNLDAVSKVNRFIKTIRKCNSGRCFLCLAKEKSELGLCAFCLENLPVNQQFCLKCGKPLIKSGACGNCLKPDSFISRRLACFLYQYPVDKLLSNIKFRHDLQAASVLAEICASWFQEKPAFDDRPDFIIPVPLHVNRLRRRGFNQSQILLSPLAKKLEIPMINDAVKRNRNTRAQSDLNEKERKQNVLGAFQCRKDLSGKHVVVFDDVITTGATSEALSKCLLLAGAKKVEVWALALRTKSH